MSIHYDTIIMTSCHILQQDNRKISMYVHLCSLAMLEKLFVLDTNRLHTEHGNCQPSSLFRTSVRRLTSTKYSTTSTRKSRYVDHHFYELVLNDDMKKVSGLHAMIIQTAACTSHSDKRILITSLD